MTILFGLAAPEPVLVLLTSELTARFEHGTCRAQLQCLRLSARPGLGPFGAAREEEPGAAATCRVVAPVLLVRLVSIGGFAVGRAEVQFRAIRGTLRFEWFIERFFVGSLDTSLDRI
jgi:hypothetical protein